LKRATDKTKKEYVDSLCDENMEFQGTGHYALMYMKMKATDWKEKHGIQDSNTEHSEGI
jgi:hypothetical protein